MAVGTPFGLARTMTLGVVSNNERTFYPDKQTIDEYETGEFANWIQMDTPINPGNSGGPLVDMTGKIVRVQVRPDRAPPIRG
jgi:S1-C subfamily serine protease